MNYTEIKEILYGSEEISRIPDRWEQSIPFEFELDKKHYTAFLYWSQTNNSKIMLNRMIAISNKNGTILVFEANDIYKRFKIKNRAYLIPLIQDYDKYFENLEKYEEYYSEICKSDEAYIKYGKVEYVLLEKIVGDDLLNNVFCIIAKNYIKKLQTNDSTNL